MKNNFFIQKKVLPLRLNYKNQYLLIQLKLNEQLRNRFHFNSRFV